MSKCGGLKTVGDNNYYKARLHTFLENNVSVHKSFSEHRHLPQPLKPEKFTKLWQA